MHPQDSIDRRDGRGDPSIERSLAAAQSCPWNCLGSKMGNGGRMRSLLGCVGVAALGAMTVAAVLAAVRFLWSWSPLAFTLVALALGWMAARAFYRRSET